jgi:microcystin-dependent protein
MTFWKWSQTASTNGTADSTCPFPEGMAPSAVNDGVRGAMAALAKYRDDIGGLTTTAGTSTAYTYSSFQVFDSFAHMNGAMIAFTPHATNGSTCTMNVDGLGAKPLRSAPGVELLAAMIIQGTPYAATYNNGSGEWILQGLYGNPYNIPLLGGMDYWGTVAPNSSFIFPQGQALSRTTYAAAFAILGTTYGAGDGSTTFNVPDKRGRVSAALDASAGRLTAATMSGTGAGSVSNAAGETQTLTQAQLPNVQLNPSGGNPFVGVGVALSAAATSGGTTSGQFAFSMTNNFVGGTSSTNYNINLNGMTMALGGSNSPHPIVQPTIVCNYIMRVL